MLACLIMWNEPNPISHSKQSMSIPNRSVAGPIIYCIREVEIKENYLFTVLQ